MKRACSREILALYIENDLADTEAERVKRHLEKCAECRQSCRELQKSQALIQSRLKSYAQEQVSPEALAGVREAVLSEIESRRETFRWVVKLERLLLVGLRRPRYAAAGLGILAIVSASLLGQIRHSRQQANTPAAVFVGRDTLVRPSGYREWVFVGSSLGLGYAQNQRSGMYHNVYINPSAYREYATSGKFPEGTVMVLEIASAEVKNEPDLQGSYENEFMGLEVSVKDSSRFEDGWAYFHFGGGKETPKAAATALPESAGCLACHRERAATDHVFTQFYPVLRFGTL